MCIANRLYSLISKIVILAVSALAAITAVTMRGNGFQPINALYYTTVSCMLAFLYFAVAAITIGVDMKKRGVAGIKTAGRHFRGGITMVVLLGALVYSYTVPGTALAAGSSLPLILAHGVLPVLVLLDWLLFDYKGRYRAVDPLWWLVFPYVYYLITLLVAQYGALYADGSLYPYYLLNPDTVGWANVLANMVLMTALYLLFGYIYFAVDRILGFVAKKRLQRSGADGREAHDTADRVQTADAAQHIYQAGQPEPPPSQPT